MKKRTSSPSKKREAAKRVPDVIYDINKELVYFTYNQNDDIVLMKDTKRKKFGSEELYIISGLAKEIFEEINGKRKMSEIFKRVIRKHVNLKKMESRFEQDGYKFFRQLSRKSIVCIPKKNK